MSELWIYEDTGGGSLTFRGMLERYRRATLTRRLHEASVLEVEVFYEAFTSFLDKGFFIGTSELNTDVNPNRIFRIEQMDGDSAEDIVMARCTDAAGLFTFRPVEPPAGLTHDSQTGVVAETAMHYYVDRWAGPGAPVPRRIPNFYMGADLARGGAVTINARYHSLDQVLQEITFGKGIGWEVVFDYVTRRQNFQAVIGVDRSDSVFFDPEYGSIKTLRWLKSDVDWVSYVIAAGQGEGLARIIETRWEGKDIGVPEPTGWDWRGVFIDSGDVSTVAGLRSRADAEIAKRKPIQVTAQVANEGSFQYRAHWDLGDVVLLRSAEENLSVEGRIVEVILGFRAGSDPDVSISVDRPYPTIYDRLEQSKAFNGRARS